MKKHMFFGSAYRKLAAFLCALMLVSEPVTVWAAEAEEAPEYSGEAEDPSTASAGADSARDDNEEASADGEEEDDNEEAPADGVEEDDNEETSVDEGEEDVDEEEEEPENDGANEAAVEFSTAVGIAAADLSSEDAGITASYDESGKVLTVTVAENGSYSFSGEAENTVICVAAGLDDVTVIFSGLEIDNSGIAEVLGEDSPALSVGKKSKVSLSLTGKNSIDGSSSAEDPEGIFKAAQGTLVISGAGSLSLTGCGDGISAKKGSVTIDGGTLDLIECADGIKAKNGSVTVNGGTINITDISGDGIQAEDVEINGGTINISTVFDNAATSYYTSGSSSTTLNTLTENGQSGTKTERINVDTGSHKGIKAGTKASTQIYSDTGETEVTEASGGLTITGGTMTIDTTGSGLKAGKVSGGSYTACAAGTYIIGSPDDAIQSNNDLEISGGTITVRSSDDGISSAGTLSITGSAKIDIQRAYEGIEAAKVVIGESGKSTGPEISIYSCDDGINVSSKTVTYTYDSADNTDCYYTKSSVSNKNNSCTVYSGKLTIKIDSGNVDSTHSVTLRNGSASSTKTLTYSAEADGIDCNGTLDIEGGEVYVYGQSSGANSPLDTDSGFTLGTGATVLATGSNDMCSESIPSTGGAVYLSIGSSAGGAGGQGGPGGSGFPGQQGGFGQQSSSGSSISFTAGSSITIKNGSTVIYEGTLPYAGSFAIFASPELVSGTTYTVTIGSTTMSVTAAQAGTASGQGGQGGGSQGGEVIPPSPSENTASENTVSENTVSENTASENTASENTESGNTASENTVSENTSSENTASENTASENTVSENTASENTASDNTASENTVPGNTVVDEASGQDDLVVMVKTGENSFSTEMVKGQRYCFGSGVWTSSDNRTVRVTKKGGTAIAKKAGETMLTNSGAGGNIYITVTVHQPALSIKKTAMTTGDTLEVSISDTGSMPVTWTSSNTSVIQVEGDQYAANGTAKGTITAVGSGSAKLKCFVGGKAYTASITVKNSKTAPVNIDIYLTVGKTTALKNGFAGGSSISWNVISGDSVTLSNTDRAKVTLTAGNEPGDTLISCTINGTDVYYTTVHVEDPSLDNITPVKDGTLNYTYTMKVGDSFKISQTGLSHDALWTSSSKKKAFVNEYGTVMARQKGKVLLKTKINGKWVKIRVVITE